MMFAWLSAAVLIVVVLIISGMARNAMRVGNNSLEVMANTLGAINTVSIAASNVTEAFSSLATATAHTGTTWIQDLSSGVDVVDMRYTQESQTVETHDAENLSRWLQDATQLPEARRQDLVTAVRALANGTLSAWSSEMSYFAAEGEWGTFGLAAQRVSAGTFRVRYVYSRASFRLIWSNPLWEWMAFNVSTEFQQAIQLVEAFVRGRAPSEQDLLQEI